MAEHNFSVENTLTLLLDDKKYHSLRDILSTMNPADIAAVFDELPESRLPLLFRLLPKELAAETFVEMDTDAQALLIRGFSDSELKEVIENDTDYKLWHAAMSAVNAIYLIVDTKTGARYVGSTYGYDGLLGRWSVYAATDGHGNNKGLISHLKSKKNSCHNLQFSVLQVLSKSLTDKQIIDAETLWKKKLLTYEPFGLNQN